MLFAYIRRLSGYSRQHLSRLIVQYRDTESLKPRLRVSRASFVCHCGPADLALLAETDSLHDTLSGPATKVLLLRAFTVSITTAVAFSRLSAGTPRRRSPAILVLPVLHLVRTDGSSIANAFSNYPEPRNYKFAKDKRC